MFKYKLEWCSLYFESIYDKDESCNRLTKLKLCFLVLSNEVCATQLIYYINFYNHKFQQNQYCA